jgi:hypothetical protein
MATKWESVLVTWARQPSFVMPLSKFNLWLLPFRDWKRFRFKFCDVHHLNWSHGQQADVNSQVQFISKCTFLIYFSCIAARMRCACNVHAQYMYWTFARPHAVPPNAHSIKIMMCLRLGTKDQIAPVCVCGLQNEMNFNW